MSGRCTGTTRSLIPKCAATNLKSADLLAMLSKSLLENKKQLRDLESATAVTGDTCRNDAVHLLR